MQPDDHDQVEAADQQQERASEQERPDQRSVRGNPPAEQHDVDRGHGKLDRISGN